MSETQLKVTDTFYATDDKGNKYHLTEYTLYRHTRDVDMVEETGGDITEYRLGNDAPVRKVAENIFEIVSDGTIIHRQQS